MSIVSGFKKVKNYIKETDGYKLLSRWTSSDTVDVNGKTLTEAINGINTSIATAARDIIENNNNGVRSILDFLTQDKIATLQAENQRLRAVAPLLTPRHHARNTCRDESFRLFCCRIAKLCVILQSCKQRSKHTPLNLSTYKKQNDEKEP